MRLIVGIVAVWISSIVLQAQNIKIFEDDYGVQGEVRSSEVFEEGKLPQRGHLDIKWRNFDGNRLITYRIKGAAKEANLDGAWIWEVARWKYTVNVSETVKPVFTTLGKRKKWEGSFADGKPNGKWVFTLDSLASDGRVIMNLIRLDIVFQNGIPVGAFSLYNNLENNALKLVGSCDKDGVANGTWVFSYKNDAGKTIKETRNYAQGLLTEIKKIDGTQMQTFALEHTMQFLNKKVDTSLVKLGRQLFEKDEVPTPEIEAVCTVLQNYFLSGWNLPLVGAKVEFAIPQFRQLAFLLTNEEIQQIKEVQTEVDITKNNIELYSNANTFIQRHRNAKIDTIIAHIELVEERYQLIDSLLQVTTTDAFTYQNKEQALMNKWKQLFGSSIRKKGEVFASIETSLPAIVFEENESFLDGILKYVKQENERLKTYFTHIEKETIAIQQEGELDKIAHQIENRYKTIEQLYYGKFGVAQDIQEQLIDGESHRLIQEFSLATEFQEAKRRGSEVLQLLDSLEIWSSKLKVFDEMEGNLKTKYRYLAYNPYTGENDIEVKIKKRFMNVILSDVWPHLNMELKAAKSWQDWAIVWNNYFNIYTYLMEFATRDDAQAQRIEKRIRKEKKPERILRMILNQIESDNIDALIGEKKTN